MDVPTNHARSSCVSLRCLGLRLMPCPVGADRMRAPLALEANGGSAMRHRRDEANIRLCDSGVNPPSSDQQVADHRVVA